jgi:hypothetical protein
MTAPRVVNDSLFRDDLIGTIWGHVIAGTQAEPDFDVEALADAVLEKVVRRLSAIVVQAPGDDPVAQLVKAEIRRMRWGR